MLIVDCNVCTLYRNVKNYDNINNNRYINQLSHFGELILWTIQIQWKYWEFGAYWIYPSNERANGNKHKVRGDCLFCVIFWLFFRCMVLFATKMWKQYFMRCKWAQNVANGVLKRGESEYELEIAAGIIFWFEQMHRI